MALWIERSSAIGVAVDLSHFSRVRPRPKMVSHRRLELFKNEIPFKTTSSVILSTALKGRLPAFSDENRFSAEDAFPHPNQPHFFDGYFQNWRLVETVKPELRHLVRHRFSGVKAHQDAVAVHVRLGDYMNPGPRGVHGVTDPAWSYVAASSLANELGLVDVVVFSDSPRHLPPFPTHEASRFSLAQPGTTWETLSAMSACRGVVTANSTFSWWAATFGSWFFASENTVLAPSPWQSLPSRLDGDLIPPRWRVVDRRQLQ